MLNAKAVKGLGGTDDMEKINWQIPQKTKDERKKITDKMFNIQNKGEKQNE